MDIQARIRADLIARDVGSKLQLLRLKRGLNLADVTEGIGNHYTYLSIIEQGKRLPGTPIMLELCRFYNVSLDWLLSGQANDVLNNTVPPFRPPVYLKPLPPTT